MDPKTFMHHSPSPEGVGKIANLRLAFMQLAQLIEHNCPHSRERSVALTHLETTAMWTIKSIVVNDPGSKVEDPATRATAVTEGAKNG